MKNIFITRKIPDVGLSMLRKEGINFDIFEGDRPITKKELIKALRKKPYDGVLCLLTDTIDAEIFDACPTAKIYANYAVGFNNVDVSEAKKRGITVTNTPGALTGAVAEHTIALMLSLARRIPESDAFTRKGKYKGWAPELFLGEELAGKKLGILGVGRIGSEVARIATQGLGMFVLYYDVNQNPEIEEKYGAVFCPEPEMLLKDADIISIHVPLLPSTTHLINTEKLALMKKSAYLINTSRGPVIDERALEKALRNGVIKGAALDVYEHEPKIVSGLMKLSNVILTPHTASATRSARDGMAKLASENLIAFLAGKVPPNAIKA